jgi:hypothetical protein
MESDISSFAECKGWDVPIFQSQGLDDLPIETIDVDWESAYLRSI